MSLADVQITFARHALIARLSGEIDMSNAEEMGATVIGATPSEASGVVLDLSGVEYVDSAGIYVVYGMQASLQARGQSLIMVIPLQSPVHDALRLSGADRPGGIAETVDEALGTLQRPSPAGT
ncbi:MAG TPA: STAS domain-containing protein [Solirubrobacteraceae bacterium]|nr:STAS domain-containing protein [Solirubrobacteraceae bacterium]